MPIRIPNDLPASEVLRSENIFTMSESTASHQDIRPLRVLILNLMPNKIETETQIMRLLSNTPLQVTVELLRVDARASRNTPERHLSQFYRDFERVKNSQWDGFIITGAPLGKIPFEEVYYWEKFKEIVDWSKTNVTSTLFLCWAAQAALNYLFDIERTTKKRKLSGIYCHQTHHHHHPLVRGFDDQFRVPISRFADFPSAEIKSKSQLTVLADSVESGVYLASSRNCKQVFITGHPEYDVATLNGEYLRDKAEGLIPEKPVNYYDNDDENQLPIATWRSHGNLLYSNWLNYCVYQVAPYDLANAR